jgi:hypothetical protein
MRMRAAKAIACASNENVLDDQATSSGSMPATLASAFVNRFRKVDADVKLAST